MLVIAAEFIPVSSLIIGLSVVMRESRQCSKKKSAQNTCKNKHKKSMDRRTSPYDIVK